MEQVDKTAKPPLTGSASFRRRAHPLQRRGAGADVMKKRVAIIGAGPMGLALASFLEDEASISVFEADSQPGGMSASFDFDGVTIEKYYHFISHSDTHCFDLLRRLGLAHDLRWRETRMGLLRQNKKGRSTLYPWGNPKALLRLTDIPLITRLRYGLHVYACKFIKDLTLLDDISASAWISRWEGKKGYDALWRFLFEKKFFQLAEPLSAAWIASRIRRVAKSRESLMRGSHGYLEGGYQSLIDHLSERLAAKGGALHLSRPVARVEIDVNRGGGLVLVGGIPEHFDTVVSTIPLPYLPRLIPRLPKEYLAKISAIRNIGCRCALFRLGRPLTDNFWLNIDMPEWDIPGIIEYSNLRPMRKAYVYMPFYMPHDHPNWRMADDELLNKARTYLQTINPRAAATEEAARLSRYEYAQPLCPPGFRHLLPPYETGARNILAADTTHSFPEHRSINESVRIAREVADIVRKSL